MSWESKELVLVMLKNLVGWWITVMLIQYIYITHLLWKSSKTNFKKRASLKKYCALWFTLQRMSELFAVPFVLQDSPKLLHLIYLPRNTDWTHEWKTEETHLAILFSFLPDNSILQIRRDQVIFVLAKQKGSYMKWIKKQQQLLGRRRLQTWELKNMLHPCLVGERQSSVSAVGINH